MIESLNTIERTPIQVLLVDDAISFHSMIELFLRQTSAYKYIMFSTTSAESMFGLLDQHPETDVVLLDISLPEENGLSACKRLRARHPTLPIIIITAKLDRELAETALKAGATDFLLKPFDGALLRLRINHAIEQMKTPV